VDTVACWVLVICRPSRIDVFVRLQFCKPPMMFMSSFIRPLCNMLLESAIVEGCAIAVDCRES
jgi:hypothetical protein